MPVTAYGKPLCRHKPPAMCDRWWCSYKRLVYLLLATVAVSVVLYVWVDHRHPASFDRYQQQYITVAPSR
jgi:hypothetical protein